MECMDQGGVTIMMATLRRRLQPRKLLPLLTLLLGYALGNVLPPAYQIFTNHSQCICLEPQYAGPRSGRDVTSSTSLYPTSVQHTVRTDQASPRSGRDLTLSTSQNHNTTSVQRSGVIDFDIEKYLHPDPSAKHAPVRKLETPRRLSKEYKMHKKLLIAVVTAEKYLPTRAKAVYETWGREATQVLFFVGSNCNTDRADLKGLPIVKLSGVADDSYPPQRKVFAMLKYVGEHYVDQFSWFLRADDDVYVRSKKLEVLLDTLNPNDRIYLGRGGLGKEHDMDRIGLLRHECYCMGGPGIVLSNAALRAITPFLDHCLAAVEQYNSEARKPWFNEDVELGRCMSRAIGLQCSTSHEGRIYFYHDYKSAALKPMEFWHTRIFKEVITVHPVKQPSNLYALHHFYKMSEYSALTTQLPKLQSVISSLCTKLPTSLSPPWMAVQPGSFADCNSQASTASSKAASSKTGEVQKLYNPMSRFDLVPWTHFNMTTMQDVQHISPQYQLTNNFRLELSQLFLLLHDYFRFNSRLSSLDILGGYALYTHIDRPEYILDVAHVNKNGTTGLERVRVLHPFTANVVVQPEPQNDMNEMVNIVIPLRKVSDSFSIPLAFGNDNVDAANVHTILCVSDEEENLSRVHKALTDHLLRYQHSSITVTLLPSNTSLTAMMEGGLTLLNEEQLVFLVEDDIEIHYEFVLACRRNALMGERVYFPIPYFAHPHTWKDLQPPHYRKGNGYWATDRSLNTACLYKADYALLQPASETETLLDRVLQSTLEVFQAPEPGLIGYHINILPTTE